MSIGGGDVPFSTETLFYVDW